MITRRLPTEIEVDGITYPINENGDYGVILDIFEVLEDKELSDREKAGCVLSIFYDFNVPPDAEKAYEKMLWFINCGEYDTDDEAGAQEAKPPQRKLMDWNRDFPLIIAPVNRVLGYDIRAAEYVHWWTLVSAYMEIGRDCTISNIIDIRRKLRDGEKLSDNERKFYNANRKIIDLGTNLTNEEEQFLNGLLGVID